MNIKGIRRICAHCSSPALQYSGWTLGGFHYYYKCSTCQKYTEYYYPLKTQVTIAAITLLLLVAFGSLVTNLNFPKTRGFYFSAIVVLLTAISYKYRRAFIKINPIDRLPVDGAILPAPNRSLRLLFITILFIALVIYASVFLSNLNGQ